MPTVHLRAARFVGHSTVGLLGAPSARRTVHVLDPYRGGQQARTA